MQLDIRVVYLILTVSLLLATMMALEGIKNIISVKNILSIGKEGLDDEAFLSGRQAGCLGLFYLSLGLFFLIVIVLVYLSLSK